MADTTARVTPRVYTKPRIIAVPRGGVTPRVEIDPIPRSYEK
ncbi:hypothetical protein [Kutzneria chonburiensis]|uniref:Lasso RiPP family leader peptide-containing protein n=1 Tax=Kutzneria chonburiensis TaxID=1483604 RepID=A0ABV6MKB3_9PSEU|nr:hypothetical protein [Kutzneria chonburiensis]